MGIEEKLTNQDRYANAEENMGTGRVFRNVCG
jgi:hypothetical protein